MPLAPEALLGLSLEPATGTSDCCLNHDFLQQKRVKEKGQRGRACSLVPWILDPVNEDECERSKGEAFAPAERPIRSGNAGVMNC